MEMADSKRRSLTVNVSGPRPLRLLDKGDSVVSSPLVSPAHLITSPVRQQHQTPSPLSFDHEKNPVPTTPVSDSRAVKNMRRQSSISYNVRSPTIDSPTTRTPLSRSSSLGRRGGPSVLSPKPDAGFPSAAGEEPDSVKQPVTLADKHAELLHFIAQKESKCLELRSQLKTNEAELLLLKRKWERIISRGFTSPSSGGSPVPPSTPLSSVPLDLEALGNGIKEGVQGVSRFIMGDYNLVPPLSSLTSVTTTPESTRPTRNRRTPLSLSTTSVPGEAGDSGSTSSISTFTTNRSSSTRYSQSSASSLGPEDLLSLSEEGKEEEQEGEDKKPEKRSNGILMVRDTGATPTMSPNPEFGFAFSRRESGSEATETNDEELFKQAMNTTNAATKLHRRKSKDSGSNAKLIAQLDEAYSSTPPPTGTFPSPSIPGVGLSMLATNAGNSWVGTVGKKWDEIRGGAAFTKGQKRASLMLSDVSHSIVSALSSPETGGGEDNHGFSYFASAGMSSPPASSYIPLKKPATANNFLDDDDGMMGASAASVMKPDSPAQLGTRDKPTGSPNAVADDEWNW